MLGLDNDWAFNIIKQVGNYGEMFDRHLAPLGLAARPERAVDQWRPAVRAAAPLR